MEVTFPLHLPFPGRGKKPQPLLLTLPGRVLAGQGVPVPLPKFLHRVVLNELGTLCPICTPPWVPACVCTCSSGVPRAVWTPVSKDWGAATHDLSFPLEISLLVVSHYLQRSFTVLEFCVRADLSPVVKTCGWL